VPVGMAVATQQAPAAPVPQAAPRAAQPAADLPAPPAQSQAPPAAPTVPAMGVLLERQPERDVPTSEPTPVERMAGIVAMLVMALVVLAGAAWQARRPSSLSRQLQPAGL
jgi:cobaltochelatase CobN